MICQRNARPGLTTWQACWRVPINDSSSPRRPLGQEVPEPRQLVCWETHESRLGIELNAEEGRAVRGTLKFVGCKRHPQFGANCQYPVEVLLALWGAGAADGNKVIQIMVYCRNPNIEHDPLQGIHNSGKDFWG